MINFKHSTRDNSTIHVLLMLLAICFLATGGIFVKMSELPPINTAFYRVLFSLPFLLPFTFNKITKVSKKEFFVILLAGVFLALDLALWNMSFQYTTVANANLLANLTPFTVIPIAYFIFKEKIPKLFFIGTAITIIGVIVLLSGKIHPSMDNFKGDALSLLTSIFYAGFIVSVYKLRDGVGSNVIMTISAFGSLAVLAIIAYIVEGFYFPCTIKELLPLIGLALVSQIFGQGLLSFCLGKVNVSLSSVVTLTQPAIAAIYSFIIFSEILSLVEIAGIFIVLTGVYLAKENGK
ncbi:MAG: DMT family transporter [Campylobacteraceae bacterium]|nr:DMT family transporter [Campylobacteraceae bacterium]